MLKLTLEEVKKYVEENSKCKLLSKEYVNAKTNLDFKCECGREFKTSFDTFKSKNKRKCNKCSKDIVKNLPSQTSVTKKSKLRDIRQKPIENILSLIEKEMKCKFIERYTKKGTRSTIVVFECPIHGVQKVYWTNLEKRRSCPECSPYNIHLSKGMVKVESWLVENNIKFEKEWKFTDCRDKRPLPFDFYIPNKQICIEVDGEQHCGKSLFKKSYSYIKEHDAIKDNYCKQQNIKLIRISYKEKNIDEILKITLK